MKESAKVREWMVWEGGRSVEGGMKRMRIKNGGGERERRG